MKIILSILNLLFISNILIAQENFNGQIFSKTNENLTPLPGVNIYWLNTSKGTISNEDGKSSAKDMPISQIPVVSAISGFMNILRIYTHQKYRKKVEIAAKSILGDLR